MAGLLALNAVDPELHPMVVGDRHADLAGVRVPEVVAQAEHAGLAAEQRLNWKLVAGPRDGSPTGADRAVGVGGEVRQS